MAEQLQSPNVNGTPYTVYMDEGNQEYVAHCATNIGFFGITFLSEGRGKTSEAAVAAFYKNLQKDVDNYVAKMNENPNYREY